MTVYYRLKVDDERVLLIHLALNEVDCLSTNKVEHWAVIKDRQLWYSYKQFNSTLKGHPGRDYFLWIIRKSAEATADGMRKRGIISETQINQLLSITNQPNGFRAYYFDM